MRDATGVLVLVSLLLQARVLVAQQVPSVQITGKNIQNLQVTTAELSKMARLAVDIRNPHSGTTEHYEGVRVSDLLAKAGVPLGEKLRGRALATSVVIQATDGYTVVFSIAELDPAMNDNRIILADTMNGKPSETTMDHSRSSHLQKSGQHDGSEW
jgi:hypothetical protein